MKELDNFTVERLEELTALSFPPSHHELAALARIALAAKRAEPVSLESAIEKFKEYNIGFPVEKLKADFVISWCLANLTPQLNSPEIPEGWKMGKFGYQDLFNAIAAAVTSPHAGSFSISVKAFEDVMIAAAPEKPL